MQETRYKILTSAFLLIIIALFFYSFTQVDLGLTLSRIGFMFAFQDFFQNVGYFQRSLSAFLYVSIISLLSVFYLLFLLLSYKGKIKVNKVWIVIGALVIFLFFSYPAFSYDLFNYIFDAKIVTVYGDNPYQHKALDYPEDPMLSFMHWTHRTYPYGPFWLALTVPLSFLGFGYFLPTLYLFKLLAVSAYMGSAYMIKKILDTVSPKHALLGLVFFALNPLVIIESLVSAHNDIVMMFFTLFAIYLLVKKRYVWSFAVLVLSIAVKFATLFLVPVFAAASYMQIKRKRIDWDILFFASILLMSAAVIGATVRTNFQPWYLLYVLPFAALLVKKHYISIPAVILSITTLFQYVPYLYFGNWDPPVPSILNSILIGAIVIAALVIAIYGIFFNSSKDLSENK